MSGPKHPLELVLLSHLGTDSAALTHLSEVLLVLKQPGSFDTTNSGVLGKWNARINSLLHSREASSRWVGLVLAKYTATSSRHILVENAQGWKAEPFPNYHAAIRLLACLFTSVTDMPEFQRQVVIPNVQKCSLAWLELAKSEESALSLKILAVDALTQFTTHHPTHHRALQQNLYSFTLEHLQGSFPLASSASLLLDQPTTSLPAAAIRLHSALPLTGGKVGASVAWRKSVDSAIATIRSLLGTLRKTYGDVIPSTTPPSFPLPPLPDDPAIAVPLALDRIRCMVRLLVHLLAQVPYSYSLIRSTLTPSFRTPTSRPVSMPLGSLSQLALKLIQSTTAEPAQPPQVPYEPIQRTVEAAAVPELRVSGCMLAQQLAQTCGKLFTPYVSRFLNAITYQLNQSSICSTQRKHFFATIVPLLAFTHTAAPSQSYTRLASHLVKALAPLLPPSSRPGQSQNEKEGERKGKKRARYEADELFSTPLALPSPSSSSKELCAYALDALQQLLPTLPLAIRDSIHRILLTILLHLPRTNQDRALSEHVARVYAACLGEGTSASGMLGVSVRAIQAAASAGDAQRTLHQFLHPRIPPHSGSGPSIDDLALFWKDEEDEETKEFRKGAEVVTAAELAKASEESPREVEMVDVPNTRPASAPVVSSEHPATAAPRTALPDFASPVLPLSTSSSMFQSTHTPAASIPSGAQSTSTFAPSSQAQSVLSSTNQGSETSKAASSSIISTSAYSSSKPLVTQSIPPLQAGSSSARSPLPTYDDDDDEPIPQIDLASDTDEDET